MGKASPEEREGAGRGPADRAEGRAEGPGGSANADARAELRPSCCCSCRTCPRKRCPRARTTPTTSSCAPGARRAPSTSSRATTSRWARQQGWLDIVRGARLAGSRNYVLLGDLSLLEGAVMRYALDLMVGEGLHPAHGADAGAQRGRWSAPATSPAARTRPTAATSATTCAWSARPRSRSRRLHQDEILDLERLPMRFVALSSCYRREAGTYGKDTRGLYRVHQFQKVEQVVVDVADEARSLEHHLDILRTPRRSCRRSSCPTASSTSAAATSGSRRSRSSTSRPGCRRARATARRTPPRASTTSRRAGWTAALPRRGGRKVTEFCHTLNNTVAASTRMLIALLENHQNWPTGRVRVPGRACSPTWAGARCIGQGRCDVAR